MLVLGLRSLGLRGIFLTLFCIRFLETEPLVDLFILFENLVFFADFEIDLDLDRVLDFDFGDFTL